jgi:DNA sulfur modification protein DndE
MSSIEMTWKVFAGHHSDAYLAVVLNEYNEAKESGFELTESDFVRLHIERGIATLANKLRKNKLPALIELGTKAA